ncbi:MAG: response regulator [Ruminiclostridium sp.]|nr:response regulator [Ruminiclostridium sp.]
MGKRKGNSAVLKNIVIAVLVMLFMVGIIITFYSMLYSANREIIIKSGETSSKETAERFDEYLSTSTDAIKLTAYTIDSMMGDGKSNQEILDYLVEQTVAIKSTVFENTSGLYGYINDEFLDGLLWEPPEGFVATERPWYIKAREKNGEVAMVEPYLDAQTGTVLMAISKLLDDGKSVISMDIALDVIQRITEESVELGRSDVQLIIDHTGYVVAHSDKEQIGKNYRTESGSIGAEIFKELNLSESGSEGYCELFYNNTHYIVYSTELKNDFLCLSIKDATSVFEPLQLMLVITVAVVIVIVFVIVLIMIISNKRQLMVERLGKQLSATADIYISMHEINFLTDTFSEVINNKEEASELIGETRNHCQETIRAIMTRFSDESSRESVLDFVDFSKLNMRLRNRNTITMEWLSVEKKWRRSRYIVSDRTPSGEVARAMYLIEDIDTEKTERDMTFEVLKIMNEQISSVAGIFFRMVDFDIENNRMRTIRTDPHDLSNLVDGSVDNALQKVTVLMDKFVHEKSRRSMVEFINFNTVNERMKGTDSITEEFLSTNNGWCRARLVVSKRNEDGTVAHVLWLVETIDEEKRKRDKLTEAAERLNMRVSSIANIYMTVHELDLPTDTFIEIKSDKKYVNDAGGEIHPRAQETISKVMESVVDPSCLEELEKFIDFSTLEKRMRRIDTITTEYMNRDKLWRRGRFVASKRDESGKLIRAMWLTEDINNEKTERDKLLDMSERAIAASEAKSSFLSNMSHEIRTPINAVLGMNEMILRECEDSTILAYSNSIRNAGTTLLGIINDILDFSKIEAGKMEIIPVDYDLSSVINDLVNMIQSRADDKGLLLELNISKEVPKYLHGDEVRIKQVITNILTNAVKYTEKGSVTFIINFEKIPDDPGSIMLDVEVRDTGIGIKREDMKKLFSEFDRIEEERNRHVEGTGLGMSITKRLLEMMNSTLEVESIYKLGSKFSFRLRQRVVNWEELGDYEAAYRDSLGARKKYTEKFRAPAAQVLVVDDTPMNLMVFRSLLKQTGVKIDTAPSGDDGLALAYDMKYDIIFLDHMMPKKDGIQTLHELRARTDDPNLGTPVICLTANAISGAREKYLAEGFDDYLTKPIDPDKLEDMLIKYLPAEKVLTDGNGDIPHKTDESEIQEDDEPALPDFLSDIDEIDIQAGIKNCGSVEGYIMALKTYTDMIGDMADETEKLWLSGDLHDTAIKIHAMKSTSRIIGASELGELAQELETAGKNGDSGAVGERIDELLARCRKLGEQLRPVSGGGPAEDDEPDKPPMSQEELSEAYTAIGEFMSVADYDSAVELIEGLKNYSVPESEKARCDALAKAAAEVEYEKITQILEKGE